MKDGYTVVVVGAGAAGIAAAITAARGGGRTLLLDQRPAAGGTGGFSGLTTLCGLFDEAGNFLNEGFCREFAEALMRVDGIQRPVAMGGLLVQPYRPASFLKVAAELIAREPLLTVRWKTPLAGVTVDQDRIQTVNGMGVRAVIDCSGTAEAGRQAGERWLATDDTTQAPAVLLALRHARCDWQSPLVTAKIRTAVARGGLPPVSLMPGGDPDIVPLKFAGSPAQVPALLAVLRRDVPGLADCAPAGGEPALARRAGAMIMGRYVLTGEDVLGARRFPDAVARNNWPVEQWSAEGTQTLERLPAGGYYEIPARALQAGRTQNLFMAGKSLSADARAAASARVMGCCLATGAAAGKLAVELITSAMNS